MPAKLTRALVNKALPAKKVSKQCFTKQMNERRERTISEFRGLQAGVRPDGRELPGGGDRRDGDPGGPGPQGRAVFDSPVGAAVPAAKDAVPEGQRVLSGRRRRRPGAERFTDLSAGVRKRRYGPIRLRQAKRGSRRTIGPEVRTRTESPGAVPAEGQEPTDPGEHLQRGGR